MPRYEVPPNTGKVRVVMGLAGTYAVWNGKIGKNQFRIHVRKRETAEQIAQIINRREHDGAVDVYE